MKFGKNHKINQMMIAFDMAWVRGGWSPVASLRLERASSCNRRGVRKGKQAISVKKEDALLLVVSFLGVPDLLRMSRTCRHLRQTLGNPDGSVITNVFQKQWGSHFAVWQPLFAVARTSTRLQTAAVCDKFAAMCGCWTLLNIEGYSSTVRGGVCSVLPTADGLRVCLVAPKRVCLDDFEWEDSHPLQDIDRAVAFLGRLSVIEAIEMHLRSIPLR